MNWKQRDATHWDAFASRAVGGKYLIQLVESEEPFYAVAHQPKGGIGCARVGQTYPRTINDAIDLAELDHTKRRIDAV